MQGPAVERIDVTALTIPTDLPEADGTLAWDSTTIILVELASGSGCGVGYTYTDVAAASLIGGKLARAILGRDAMDVPGAVALMVHEIRNLGRPGICSTAIAAVDAALWDLKARLLGVPLAKLLGRVRESVPAYGSGGFTSYTDDELREQFEGWAGCGLRAVKMKVGSAPERDPHRVRVARKAVGDGVDLFVDANGAYSRKQALRQAQEFFGLGVVWFEEPVTSDDLEGLRLIRDSAPPMMIAAGEYGYDLPYFKNMIGAGAVDVLQADATRCGSSAFFGAGALCAAHTIPFSAHTAPSLHTHLCCAVEPVMNVEYFHDHARIEKMIFDGAIEPIDGQLRPDLARPGNGLEIKRSDAARYVVYEKSITGDR